MAEQAGRQYAAFTQLPPMAGLPGGTSQSSIDLPPRLEDVKASVEKASKIQPTSCLDVFPMRWGGSFWHHDITDVKVRQTFMRRKERFLNAQNENLLFIRVVNGTQELMQITGLYSALQERFGDKSRVRLLVLIDLQDTEQEVITQDLGRDVIFSCVHHSSWESHIPAPTPEEQARLRLHKASDSYSAALVRALYIWASEVQCIFQLARKVKEENERWRQNSERDEVNRKERKELLKVAAQIPADNTATLHFQQSGAVTATEKLQLSMTGFDIYQKAYEHVMQKDRAFSIKVP
eukprot:g8937.t1